MFRLGLGPEYRKLWIASAISNLGDGVTLIAGPLLAAALTRDPILVAGLAFAQMVPWLLFSLVSGALVDRLDRRLTMGIVDLFRSALIGALGLAVLGGFASLPLLYIFFFMLGTAETLFDNAAQAILPTVVKRDSLERANGGLSATVFISNQFAGPPLGGFLFGVAVSMPFLLDAGTFAAAAALVLTMRGRFHPTRPEGSLKTTLRADIAEGIRWLWRHRLLRTLAIMLGVENMMFETVLAIFVLFAQGILGLGSVGYGLLFTAFAAGGLIGSLVSDRIVTWLGAGRALRATILINATALAVIAWNKSVAVVGTMFLVTGATVVVWNVITVSFRQSIVPEHIFGRVNSVYRMVGWGGISLGALLGGFLARSFGLTAPFWVAAGVLVIMALVTLPLVNNRTMAEARRVAGLERCRRLPSEQPPQETFWLLGLRRGLTLQEEHQRFAGYDVYLHTAGQALRRRAECHVFDLLSLVLKKVYQFSGGDLPGAPVLAKVAGGGEKLFRLLDGVEERDRLAIVQNNGEKLLGRLRAADYNDVRC